MMRLVVVLWTVVACVSGDVNSRQLFSSTDDLLNVLGTERHVVNLLDQYIADMEAKIDRMKQFIADSKKPLIASDNDAEVVSDNFIGNPLHAYQTLKRLAIDWGLIMQMMSDKDWGDIVKKVTEQKEVGFLIPTEEDLQGAALGLIRLQDTYRLNTTELSRGNILGIHSSVGLTARDCLYLGKCAYYLGNLDVAIEWLQEAVAVAQAEGNATASLDIILPELDNAIRVHDESVGRGVYRTFKYPVRSVPPAQQRNEIQATLTYKLGNDLNYEDEGRNFNALCRGEKLLSLVKESRLKCFYSHRNSSYLILSPVKVEVAHENPDVLTFHSVLTDAEIEHIKKQAASMLERSTVLTPDGTGREVSHTRTSKNAWIYDDDVDPVMDRIVYRVSQLTKLRTVGDDNAEALQVANYGIGGHYVPHYDFLFWDKTPDQLSQIDPAEYKTGDRIATLMFYLSDVTKGGATVFPKIGVAVWPSKGSAAFWHNLRRCGSTDMMTLHGACPVLHGSKWVANKWIREREQLFTRPCTQNSWE